MNNHNIILYVFLTVVSLIWLSGTFLLMSFALIILPPHNYNLNIIINGMLFISIPILLIVIFVEDKFYEDKK